MGACCTKDERFDGFMVEEDAHNEDHHHKRLHEGNHYGDPEDDDVRVGDGGALVRLKGSSKFSSMFSRQGKKGINQDAMTVLENFMGEEDTIFCAVFDGHGPSGHKVARHVRDNLPSKLYTAHNMCEDDANLDGASDNEDFDDDVDITCEEAAEGDVLEDGTRNSNAKGSSSNSQFYRSWKNSFMRSYRRMDEELSVDSSIDSYCSGTTAVAIVKQGDELIVANLGDSRAVLCTRNGKKQLFPLQITTDLKPNLLKEAERIKRRKGRVFSLDGEPDVYRVWMPEENCPGLAMSRAFGDFCLKDFGLVSNPQFSHRKLTDDDEFLVLATDGVWDVLTNDEVMRIVATARRRSVAAKRLVDNAVKAWRIKHPTSRVDDCAAICVFLKPPPPPQPRPAAPDTTNQSDVGAESSIAGSVCSKTQEWTALDAVSRANSLVNLPRYGRGATQRPVKKTVKEFEDLGAQY